MRFTSFFNGGLIIAKVVNKPERKLAKCTSVYCTNKKLVKEFLTAILHRGLKPDVFSSADLLFPFFIWTFILFFYWTFISLFYLDIFIFFFSLFFNFLLILFQLLFISFFLLDRGHILDFFQTFLKCMKSLGTRISAIFTQCDQIFS